MLEDFFFGVLIGILSTVHIFPHSKSFWETIYDFLHDKYWSPSH